LSPWQESRKSIQGWQVALDMAADADAEDTKHSGKRGKGGLFD